jgi:hypothetical protein
MPFEQEKVLIGQSEFVLQAWVQTLSGPSASCAGLEQRPLMHCEPSVHPAPNGLPQVPFVHTRSAQSPLTLHAAPEGALHAPSLQVHPAMHAELLVHELWHTPSVQRPPAHSDAAWHHAPFARHAMMEPS